MKVLNKKSFKLPFVERGIFAKLIRLDLDFDKRQGAYYVENYNEVEKIIDIISDVLGGEKISFLQTCLLCGRGFLARISSIATCVKQKTCRFNVLRELPRDPAIA